MAKISKTFVLLLGLSMPVAGWAPPPSSLCDINQDGTINVVDIQHEMDQVLRLLLPTNDLNGDGAVDVVDVQIEITAALGVTCLAGPETHSIGTLFSIENTTPVAPTGPQTYAVDAAPVSVENTTPVAPTGPQSYAADAAPVSIENTTPVAPTGPQAYAVDAAPVSIENTTPVAPTGPMTFAATGGPFSMLNATSPAAPPPLTFYVSGLKFSIFNGLTPTSLQPASATASLRFRLPVDPTFLTEALARGAQRIDGKAVCLDTDGDGLCDADELIIGTSPYLADTDGDGYPDGLELALGSDPLDPNSIPEIRPPGYFATPPVSIQKIIPVAILTPRTQGATHAAENR